MKAVGVIPARWGSTRLPGKSLIEICGKPLIHWVIENAGKAKSLERLIVATDDERIAQAVKGVDAEVVMTRPDHPSGTDRVAEVVAGLDVEVVINIQGDEPLIDPDLIDNLSKAILSDDRWDMATAATPIEKEGDLENPSVVKVVWDNCHKALYFSRSLIPFVRDNDQEGSQLHWRHLGIYAYRKGFLENLVSTEPCALENAEKLEQLRALHIGAEMLVLETSDTGIGVDTREDVEYVENILKRRSE